MPAWFVALNCVCLTAAAAVLGWARRPPKAGRPASFARALAAAAAAPRDRLAAAPGVGGGGEAPPLPLAQRLGAVRRMLQGDAPAEAAAALGVPVEAVRALYRLHGREGAGPC